MEQANIQAWAARLGRHVAAGSRDGVYGVINSIGSTADLQAVWTIVIESLGEDACQEMGGHIEYRYAVLERAGK